MRLYVPGAGALRTGRAAWPHQDENDAVFAEFLPNASVQERVEQVADIAPAEPVDVVAHSLGAVPALLAVHQGLVDARRLILLEPALYDLARGDQHIETHISTVTQAREHSAAGDLYGFWQIFRPLFFGGTPDRGQWEKEQAMAQHFATVELPWGHGITAEMLPASSAVVVTGNWNPEYEAIAAALSSRGARHIHVTGSAHRPQDHEHFEQTVFSRRTPSA